MRRRLGRHAVGGVGPVGQRQVQVLDLLAGDRPHLDGAQRRADALFGVVAVAAQRLRPLGQGGAPQVLGGEVGDRRLGLHGLALRDRVPPGADGLEDLPGPPAGLLDPDGGPAPEVDLALLAGHRADELDEQALAVLPAAHAEAAHVPVPLDMLAGAGLGQVAHGGLGQLALRPGHRAPPWALIGHKSCPHTGVRATTKTGRYAGISGTWVDAGGRGKPRGV